MSDRLPTVDAVTLTSLTTLWSHEGAAADLVRALKYRRRTGAVTVVADELAAILPEVDLITWAPASRSSTAPWLRPGGLLASDRGAGWVAVPRPSCVPEAPRGTRHRSADRAAGTWPRSGSSGCSRARGRRCRHDWGDARGSCGGAARPRCRCRPRGGGDACHAPVRRRSQRSGCTVAWYTRTRRYSMDVSISTRHVNITPRLGGDP